jgi:hypothetical protein
MGVRIKSLMAAAHAAGYAMAPEDMYFDDQVVERPVSLPVAPSTALVPVTVSATGGLFADARSLAGRYISAGWMPIPRLTA